MNEPLRRTQLGAQYVGEGRTLFRVWAPRAEQVAVHLYGPDDRIIPLLPQPLGYFVRVIDGVWPGTRYKYRLNDQDEWPDPASRWQPDGVHGPSAVVDLRFPWTDTGWRGLPLDQYIIYELHIGTFTPEGTFDAAITRLPDLVELGVTAVEIMPVGQFPGRRNWGYDGVQPFAVQSTYGGPAGLQRFVDACHAYGLAAILDVVYNHLGPEGNYTGFYGYYQTSQHRTPWGDAINFDDAGSDEVRRYFLENARQWFVDFHFDALRLDAVHAIQDSSVTPFLTELGWLAQAESARLGRPLYLIAESNRNDPWLVRPPERGGHGLHAQWADDFHHALHARLTGERTGYYCDFGALRDLAAAWRDGFTYAGRYSTYHRRRRGAPADDLPSEAFVISTQNHDQAGNRAFGERLANLVDFPSLKLAAMAVLLAPYTPLLFMGEEYGERAPFLYFIDHEDPALVEAVRKGRREEFAAYFDQREAPDPAAPETMAQCVLNFDLKNQGQHRHLYTLYRELIHLRKTLPALANRDRHQQTVRTEGEDILIVIRPGGGEVAAILLNFATERRHTVVPAAAQRWRVRLDSSAEVWGGPGGFAPGTVLTPGQVIALPGRSGLLLYADSETG